MSDKVLDRVLAEGLARHREWHRLRVRRAVVALDAAHVQIDGRRFVNFASNNYLGLTHHSRVLAATKDALSCQGAGSGASALISGYSGEHLAAERAISAWKGTEAAVLLPSGYQAAHAAIQTLAGAGAVHSGGIRFLIDKLCHASLIDAVHGTQRSFRVFPHNHLTKLRRLLESGPAGQLQVVITESIFSMDGDAADLRGLAELKAKRPFVLLVDEAHGSGVYGPGGAGYAAECGLQGAVDISLVTLSKAVGVIGGAVCGSGLFCESVVNWGRAYIYSTSVPPMLAAAVTAAIRVMRDEPERQQRVRMLAARVRERLMKRGFALVGREDSPIIPMIVGSEQRALEAAGRLQEAGLLVVAIRPPTVAPSSSRLRVTLCCEHSDEEVELLLSQLDGVAKDMLRA